MAANFDPTTALLATAALLGGAYYLNRVANHKTGDRVKQEVIKAYHEQIDPLLVGFLTSTVQSFRPQVISDSSTVIANQQAQSYGKIELDQNMPVSTQVDELHRKYAALKDENMQNGYYCIWQVRNQKKIPTALPERRCPVPTVLGSNTKQGNIMGRHIGIEVGY